MNSPDRLIYSEAICSIFEAMFEPWMDDEDKQKFIAMTLMESGLTMADLDRDLAKGVANGHPIDEQVEIVKKTIFGSTSP